MAMGHHGQPVLGPPQRPGARRRRTLQVESADMRPGSRYRYWHPKTGLYSIFMAGASLRVFYTERKGFMLAPPQPWAWYYNPEMYHSTGPNPDLDRAQSVDGPFPTGPIAQDHRFNKNVDTWEEFYAKSSYKLFQPYNEDEQPTFDMTDVDVDLLVSKLAERGFKLVPADEADEPEFEEEGTDDDQHQREPGDSTAAPDGDVSEQEGSTGHFVTNPE